MGSIGEKRVREDEGGVGSEKEKRSVTETACSDLTDSVGDGAGVVMKALSKGERERRIADAIQTVLECLEEDPSREGLRKTPSRYAKALMDFTNGYRMSLREVVGDAEFEESHSEIVFLSNVEVHSLCEHHMVPFHGKCHIAYIPNGKVIGLSKLARITELFSRRLQIQERLTREIAEAVQEAIDPLGVAVFMEASHMCMVMRGVKKTSAKTVTMSMIGCFKNEDHRRSEFMNLVRGAPK
uniref:GTP cyclohydrolase 1 n=1 Tax=Rhodosorus marinus TaxID=101924 RepID=A0A7S3E8A9_9RHOD|mmetsp:Transcript_14158/g.56940  ORF Transcript_14158/g.56940 Transcript_14158/m.56940 type:complete len:240 (+) Transcript_14158:131-850(+)